MEVAGESIMQSRRLKTFFVSQNTRTSVTEYKTTREFIRNEQEKNENGLTVTSASDWACAEDSKKKARIENDFVRDEHNPQFLLYHQIFVLPNAIT
ncbi:hypothetical protein RIR_jg24989.t1 [Rhizophagus irregularis DAOM 181602=DAOM 197198]|nr:hypothetical protein RIR_jg24989.t1 [Rhizophagus irregularis DAOM 181602=DAOM 197198]